MELVTPKAWQERGLTLMLADLGLNPSRIATALLLVAHPFIEPFSERKTLRRLFGTDSLANTRLPLEDGRIVTVRKPNLPDAEQARVYQILGINWKRAGRR